jgi:glycosyltransferase involved in cell wall biosynthesis
LVSIVLGTYNRRSFLRAAVNSVRNNGMDFPYEIIVVDGGSTDGSLKYLASQKDVLTVIQHNRGSSLSSHGQRRSWGYFMNLGFKIAQGKYILMISDDCVLAPGSIKAGVDDFDDRLARGQNLGALAFYWRNWPGQQKYSVAMTLGGKMFVNHGLYLRSALQDVGWIDAERYRFYHADADLSLRLWQRGYEVADCRRALVEHFTHANRRVRRENMASEQADWKTFLDRWTDIYYDPATNNTGDRVYLDVADQSHAVRSFPWVSRVLASTELGLRGVWRRHVKPLVTG